MSSPEQDLSLQLLWVYIVVSYLPVFRPTFLLLVSAYVLLVLYALNDLSPSSHVIEEDAQFQAWSDVA